MPAHIITLYSFNPNDMLINYDYYGEVIRNFQEYIAQSGCSSMRVQAQLINTQYHSKGLYTK